MAKENKTPHLDKWMRTFKTVGSGAGKIAKGVMESAAPGITSSAQSIVDASREAQSAYNTAKGKVKDQLDNLNRTIAGKNAQTLLNEAYNDIKNGTFSLNKMNDSSYDSIDDFDEYIDSISVDASDPDSIALGESKKNMAILGRTVAEGNAATIEGMQNMTATLSNVQIKTSQASISKMSAVVLTGVNQLSSQLNGVNGRLDVINKNLVSILDFQRNNAAVTNQTAIEYYSESSRMLQEMGAVISEMKDFMDNQKSMKKKKPDDLGYDPYDMSSGFNFENYKELVKHNFKNSSVGSMLGFASMMGTMGSMGSSFGVGPMDMALSMFGSSLLPKNLRKSIERLDKTFTSSIDELLYRIGDMRYDSDAILKPIIGSILGKKRPGYSGANLGNFKKDSMGWNGIAQKTLVEVIPSYLARIESSLTKSSERFYNMDTGKFMSREDIQKDYQGKYSSTVEFGMRDFTEELNEAFKKSNVSKDMADSIYDVINRVTDDHIRGKGKSKDLNTELYNSLRGNVGANELRDLMMSFTENIDAVKKSINEFNKSMEEDVSGSIYRNLFNEGQSVDKYHKKANLNSGNKYTKSGKLFDDLTEEEKLQEEADDQLEKKLKGFKDKFFKSKKDKKKRTSFDQRMASHVDNFTNYMYDKVYGYDGYKDKPNGPITAPIQSRLALPMFDEKHQEELNRTQSRVMNETFDKAINATETSINTDVAVVNGLMNVANGGDESSLKALVLGLYTNFLKPMGSTIVGKNGLLGKINNFTKNEHIQKLKKALFDEKDGVFGGVTRFIKDQMSYIKQVFTGKGYTDSEGNYHKGTDNSVAAHLTNGYDFVFKNTMKYMFGDDYENNQKFQKYFSWMDIKGRKERKKRNGEIIDVEYKEVTEEPKKSSSASNNTVEPNTTATLQNGILALPDKSADVNTTDLAVARQNIVKASEEASITIIESANQLSTEVLGNEEDLKKVKEESVQSITSNFKKNLPKTLAAGVVGAAVGTSVAAHGAGVIGSLFLPGGPISGAMLGIGLSIMSRSKAFQDFLFGKEDKDGKRVGGIISSRFKDFMKKSMPLIVGASALGAVKGLLKSTVGMGVAGSGTTGVLLNTLLPGGPIGGAVLGLSIAMLKNNTRFNKILFGEKSEDGKERTGGMFSNSYNRITKAFSKSGHFVKGGLKGLVGGVLTGATISKMGIIGASLTAGGPIGMGLAGLGLGIASQTKKFQELLFGTEEFDKDGNYKGRAGNGILTRMQNLMVTRIFEPLHDAIQERVEDFAYFLKRNITYPFRLAFGPILDSMKSIKTDISDAIHESFNNMADTVGKAIKSGFEHIFKPFTSLFKIAGKTLVNGISFGAKLATLPVSAPLKVLSFMTSKARRKARGEETKTIIENFGDILSGVRSTWENEDQSKYEGFGGRINKFLTHGRDIIQGVDAARLAYEEGLGQTGRNSLNWMNVKREMRADKIDLSDAKKNRKQWKALDKYRNEINKENGYADINYTDEENEKIRAKLNRMGVDRDWIASDEDLKLFFKNKNAWRDKFDPNKNGSLSDIAKNGIKLNETGEQAQARRNTAKYQKDVLERFDKIVAHFTAIGIKKGIRKKQNLDLDSVKDLDKELKEKGLTWDDIGVDPSDILDPGKLKSKDWELYLREKFSNGEIKNTKNDYSSFVKDKLNREDVLRSNLATLNDEVLFSDRDIDDLKNEFHKAGFEYNFESIKDLIDWLDGNIKNPLVEKIKKDEEHNQKQEEFAEKTANNTEESLIYDATNEMKDGVSPSDINISTGRKMTSKNRRMANKFNSIWKKKEDEAKEADKDAYLKNSKSTLDKDDDKRNTVFDVIKGGIKSFFGGIFNWITHPIKSFFGGIFNWITHPTTWKVVGGALTIAGLYGGKIKEFLDPIFNKIGIFMEEKGLPFLEKSFTNIMNLVTENFPTIVERFTSNVINNMGPIVESALKIIGSGLETIFKMSVNKVANYLGKDDVFQINGITNNVGKTFESYEEALEANNGNAENIHQNSNGTATIMGDTNDVDENGNATRIGNSSFKSTLTREGIQFVRSNTNRRMAKNTTKAGLKVAGWATGVIPGAKVGKAIIGGTVTTAKGVASVGSALVNAVRNGSKKAASETGTAIVEANIKEAAQDTAEKVAKEGTEAITEAAAEKKSIKFFLERAKNIIKGISDKLPDGIKPSKFKEFIDKIIKELAEKLSKSNNGILKKVGQRITEKTVEATGRTVASATIVVGIGFGVWDAINGALSASYLFGVNDSDVTPRMRLVSSVMEFLLGTGPGAWIDILLEIYGMVTGSNPKQWFARSMYKVLGGDAEYLNDAITELELETRKYNEKNGTKLTTQAYNEKKNSSNTILGRIKKGWTKLTNKEKYKEKYDFSDYAISEAELQVAKNSHMAQTSSSIPYSYNQNEYDGSDLTWGSGPRSKNLRVGYGSLQSDARWANYELGRFPNGAVSTMSTGGCGPTALAMIANTYGSKASPLAVAKYARENGYIRDGGATAGLFTDGAEKFGLKSKALSTSTLKDALESGKPVILSGKSYNSRSSYTAAGHVIKAQGYNNGYVKVSDPMRGESYVKIDDLTSGMTHGWSYSPAIGYGVPLAGVSETLSKQLETANDVSANKKYTPPIAGVSKSISDAMAETKKFQSDNTVLPDLNTLNKDTTMRFSNSSLGFPSVKDYAFDSKINNPVLFNYGTKWASYTAFQSFLKRGMTTNSSGVIRWNDPEFYHGLKVSDIKTIALSQVNLLSNPQTRVFKIVYDNFVKSGKYKDNYRISTFKVSQLIKGTPINISSNANTEETDNGETKSVFSKLFDTSSGWLGAIGNMISGFAKIAGNLLTSSITGEKYKSIFDTIEDDTPTEESTAIITENQPLESSDINNNTSGLSTIHEGPSGRKYGGRGRSFANSMNNGTGKQFSGLSTIHEGSSGRKYGGSGRSFGIGGFARDLYFGPETNLVDTSQMPTQSSGGFTGRINTFMNDLGAIAYATNARVLGQDYESAKQEYYAKLSGSSTANLNTAGNVNVSVSGTDTKEKIWSFLTGGAGLTPNAAAGIMGCWEAESHNDPTVVEGYYLKGYPGFDVVSRNESAMDNFVTGVLFPKYASSGVSINKNAYLADGHYYPGFGLAQWTGPRAKKLKDFAASRGQDWRNLEGQLDYFYNYNGEFGSRQTLKDQMNAATSPEDAATLFLDGYEMNSSTWHLTERGQKQNTARRAYAKQLYTLLNKNNPIGNGLGQVFGNSRAIGYGYSWLQIVQAVKQALASKNLGYSQSRYITLNVLGIDIPSVRTDCSGFVSACLKLYGSMNGNMSSYDFVSATSIKGFTKSNWQGWEALQPGDIISKNGHVEIFGKNENGQHYVFTAGSTNSINNPGMTTDSKSYTVVWRPNEYCNVNQLSQFGNNLNSASMPYVASTGNTFISPLDSIGNIFSSFAGMAKNVLGFGPGSIGNARTPAGFFSRTLNGDITSYYGQRSSVFGNEFHRGLDIASRKGTPVVSPIDGTLVSSGTDTAGYGNYAVIRSSDGNNHLFAHLNKPIGFGVGTKISKNDIIGEVGSTGKSTGDHLHYEIRRDGNKYSTINPMNYKYDRDTGKNLNINKLNNSNIGSGLKDLTSDEATSKLNIALNTHNVETKLDSLIEVMKSWAERDAQAAKTATQNNTNITTNNVSYGSGKVKKSTSTSKSKKSLSSDKLLSIHKAIAAKA